MFIHSLLNPDCVDEFCKDNSVGPVTPATQSTEIALTISKIKYFFLGSNKVPKSEIGCSVMYTVTQYENNYEIMYVKETKLSAIKC